MGKQCKDCLQIKSIGDFTKGNQCKDCRAIYNKNYRIKNEEKLKQDAKIYREVHREELLAKDKQKYQNNKEKIKEDRKIYRKNNPDKVKASRKKYYSNNREQIIANNKEYDNKNADKVKARKNSKRQERRRSDAAFKLRELVSLHIHAMLKIAGTNSKKSILQFLPYSINELKQHLENQFEPWMTWENHGIYNSSTWNDHDPTTWTWQIDHIIPQSDLSYSSMEDDNFKKCWSLANLRPLSAKQNNYDGANRTRHQKSKK